MVNYGHYAYHIARSDEHHGYVGTSAEFPSLSHLDETRQAAQNGIVELVKQVVTDMVAIDETPPIPFMNRPYR